jgi:hypothetical protein
MERLGMGSLCSGSSVSPWQRNILQARVVLGASKGVLQLQSRFAHIALQFVGIAVFRVFLDS